MEARMPHQDRTAMRRSGNGDAFETTQWNIVVSAGDATTVGSRGALYALCEKYYSPLYAFVRRKGYDVEDAQDLTQGFFARLIEKGSLKHAHRERGKFRAFLLASLKNYLANEWDRAHAAKRGGGKAILSLDFQGAEGAYQCEPIDALTPEKIYERRWLMTLIHQTMDRLGIEYREAGKGPIFEKLNGLLTGEGPAVPYKDLAEELGMSQGALKVAVHRLRKRFGALLRAEISETLSVGEDVEAEIRHLFSICE